MTDEKLTQEQADEKQINDAFQELLDRYLESKHRKKVEIITKAFNFAKQAHKGVRRRSGEPYILHPIAVARIACVEIGLGSTSICSALLHDVVEDTDYTVEDIENLFGPKIAQIVDGLTKISGGIFGDRASAQAENFKKLLLTMNDDIRVILIKIADRLHNMRTLGSMLPSKQYKIAGETLYIYAPLANRLGLNRIKTELEDLSFKYEHPETYKEIQDKLQATQAERESVFTEFTAPIRAQLNKMKIPYRILARVKSPYSIWNKMQTKHITFEEIYDILAVRIIFTPRNEEEELNDCFDIYVAISKIYKPHPDRLRDWVSHPKANGYQALHVTLMSNKGQWIEVQIRSERMNDVAEQGFAAHWKYKEGGGSEDEGELSKWLKTIKEILDDPQPDALDFLDTIKLNLFASEIFVFTPKGEIKTMPQNCTALDFAFSIHTFLGSHCIGAKVNHKLVPLSHKLQSGDQVEILTSKSQKVQPSWINFATTAKAKAKIQAILKREKKEMQQKGEDMLTDFFHQENLPSNDENIKKLCNLHHVKNYDELTLNIGQGIFSLGEADKNELKEKPSPTNWKKYISFAFGGTSKNKQEEKQAEQPALNIDKKKIIKLTPDAIQKNYILADCCKPIPGDDVLGYIDDNNRIVIHKRQCPIAAQLKTSFGNRLLAVEWETGKALNFPVNVYIKGIDGIGVLNQVTQVISQQLNVNIHKLNIESNDGIFEGRIQLYVHDVDDVNTICTNLKKIDHIKKVTRIENFEDTIAD
ncbi:RelA/SpoT family protein [Phocaeicola coprocola]|jgi:guanosine-3',5'-bis(diphosphate) 3'-pyrophosphohydrolase|uniref:Bifunctional (P)ppGpp synthetase/guanosine-3',5'-bis(Diphosphate) 3'-pyrophosphohydrolase n=1 Tax=Phocaeicola coprocola TaxID=310298 RepID=A0A412GTE5_9BACT|nr:RelA/SpoT family protein [Phocaeicola coprocola]RGR98087.1 bifunctional (p)ppGpp synthetase/guanosine-3',5'-bis(diphosphate) 3'-pyrophosphohydrolase [Phocaeicola coprocola]